MTGEQPSVDLETAHGVATIAINNPRRRNCFTPEMFDQLHAAAGRIASDGAVRVVILRGAGAAAFSAGMDIDSLGANDRYMENFRAGEACMNRATEAIAALEIPVIAGLRGACMGGGVQVAVAADFRLAADDLRFAVPAIGLGVMYPLAPIEQLVRMAGPAAVKKLMIEGGIFDAANALALGFVEEIAPAAAFDQRLADIAAAIAAHPPELARAYKQLIDNMAAGNHAANPAIRAAAEATGVLAERIAPVLKARKSRRDGGT
jgi:enoyl-CoA hydratase/carnithine racemase